MLKRWTIFCKPDAAENKVIIVEEGYYFQAKRLVEKYLKKNLHSIKGYVGYSDDGSLYYNQKSVWDHYSQEGYFKYLFQGLNLPLEFNLEALKAHPAILVLMREDLK